MRTPRPVRPGPLVLAGVVALTMTACGQLEEANDNPNPRQDSRTVVPPTILRTPTQAPDAPAG